MIKKKQFNNFLYFFFLFLIFSIYVNFFKSIYLLSFRDYNERMLRTYGWGCETPYAYEFIKMLIDSSENNDKNFYIHNFYTIPKYWLPPINSIFLGLEIDKSKKNLFFCITMKNFMD